MKYIPKMAIFNIAGSIALFVIGVLGSNVAAIYLSAGLIMGICAGFVHAIEFVRGIDAALQEKK